MIILRGRHAILSENYFTHFADVVPNCNNDKQSFPLSCMQPHGLFLNILNGNFLFSLLPLNFNKYKFDARYRTKRKENATEWYSTTNYSASTKPVLMQSSAICLPVLLHHKLKANFLFERQIEIKKIFLKNGGLLMAIIYVYSV